MFSFVKNLFCVDIGSDTAVNRFNTQQTLYDGDRIAGFTALQGGFKLADSSVTGIYDSFFPVSGDLDFFGGALLLRRDLTLANQVRWNTLGSIIGNNHSVHLPVTFIGNAISLLDKLPSEWGTPISSNWAYDGNYIAMALDRYGETDTVEFDNNTLIFRDDNYTTIPDESYDVVWHPSQYYIAQARQNGTGNEFQTLSVNPSTGVQTIINGINLGVDVYAVDWHPSGNWIAIAKNDAAQEIEVYSVNSSGVLNTTPVSTYNTEAGVRPRAIDWNPDGDFLAVGLEASASNELLILSFNQTTSTLSTSTTFLTGSAVNAVAWSHVPPDFLAIGLEGTSGELLRVYEFDTDTDILTQRASRSDFDTSILTIGWNPILNYFSVGCGTNSGSEFRTYYISGTSYLLDEIASENTTADILALSWSKNGKYITLCDNDTSATYGYGYLSVYALSAGWDNSGQFSDINFYFNGDIELDNVITFTGTNSSINGTGHVVTITENGGLIAQDCNVTIKDLKIIGLNGTNIQCTGTAATIILDNIEWVQSDDFEFTEGHLEFINNVKISGEGHGFKYSSGQDTTINAFSNLIFDHNVTFSYMPPTANKDLIKMIDKTSKLTLDGATMFSTSTGLRLTKGSLYIKSQTSIFSESNKLSEAISFGDGVNATNNLNIYIIDTGTLNIFGYIIDNTV